MPRRIVWNALKHHRCELATYLEGAKTGIPVGLDELIDRGVIGGAERNGADFPIGTSVSLLLTMDDVRPMIDGRPAERLARELVPHQPGHTPSVYAT